MLQIEPILRNSTIAALQELYGAEVDDSEVTINLTPREFEGDYSVVIFPFLKYARKKPEDAAREIGDLLMSKIPDIDRFNVVKGYVNIILTDRYWVNFLSELSREEDFGHRKEKGDRIVLEYCGPNTNKPLHLGHIRNMVIGYSMAEILKSQGSTIHKVNIYNDRGIAISKSMVAWREGGKNETPASTGMKGDHLVGKYYVEYEHIFQKQHRELIKKGLSDEEARKEASIYKKAQEMLRKWEMNDPETIDLWKQMNEWVYEGFEVTYTRLGVDFEKHYYESETYISGKQLVEEGLEKGSFYKKNDNSVWVDLTDRGLDEKILLRSDGTSVYLTQDLGTAQARYNDYKMDQSIYVVADEQDYHFKTLKYTLQKLEKPFAGGIHHLSYGMVDLPTGKMKSREGTTVDADDLVDEMERTARTHTSELGKIEDLESKEARELFHKIGMGALKYFLLRVSPRKRILFDPQESIEFQGDTGPFIQYTHARIRSVLRKWDQSKTPAFGPEINLSEEERKVLLHLQQFPMVLREAAEFYDPSQVANFIFNLSKIYNKFYAEMPILNESSEEVRHLRIVLSQMVAQTIKKGMSMLGIDVPEKM